MEEIQKARASKHKKMLDIYQRSAMRDEIMHRLLLKEITLGQALKYLRLNLLAMKQERYAQLVKVSRKTLSDLENDKGNYSIDIINQVLRPFELEMGVVPIKPVLFTQFLAELPQEN